MPRQVKREKIRDLLHITVSSFNTCTLRFAHYSKEVLPYLSSTSITFFDAAEYFVKSGLTKINSGQSFLAIYPGMAERWQDV